MNAAFCYIWDRVQARGIKSQDFLLQDNVQASWQNIPINSFLLHSCSVLTQLYEADQSLWFIPWFVVIFAARGEKSLEQ